MITVDEIRKFCPTAKQPIVDTIVKNWPLAVAGGIVMPLRVQHFMSQIAVESGGLRSTEESLNYSVEGLRKTFGKHRISDAECEKHGRKKGRAADQQAIANIVYGGEWGRKNLGNTEPGDGWRYHGGGLMQTTGRANYRDLGFEDNPDDLREPANAFASAVSEWVKRGCNELADRDDITAIRKVINGGTNGLADAKKYLNKAKAIFTATSYGDAPVVVVEKPVAPAPISREELTAIQARLKNLGYHEVGIVDGLYGSRTRGAILAFQADRGLLLTGEPSLDLMTELSNTVTRRPVSESRAAATVKEVKKEKPAAAAGDTMTKLGRALLAASGVGAVLEGSGDVSQLIDGVNKLKLLGDTIGNLSPWIIGVVIGSLVIYFGKKIVEDIVEEYREGKTL